MILGSKGHTALGWNSDRGIRAVNPPRISLDATKNCVSVV